MDHESTRSRSRLSRRTTLLGLGVSAAIALGNEATSTAAQESTPAIEAGVPLVGAWQWNAYPDNPESATFAIFHADGTYVEWQPVGGTAIGIWRTTGERTYDLLFVFPDTDPSLDGFGPGTATFTVALTLDATGNALAAEGMVDVRDANGVLGATVPWRRPATRLTFTANPALGSIAAPPVAAIAATPLASPTAAGGQMATINGVELYYELHGPDDGPPVLLLHGGLGNTEEFDGLVPGLVAAGYQTIAMDCRGRGRSTWDETPITYELMASDALDLLDLLGIAQTDFVGWSDGAIIGLELGVTHPERLHRAVIYGANFTPDGFHFPTPSDQLPPFEQFIADYQRLSPAPERFDELNAMLDALYAVAPNFSEEQLRSIPVPMLILDGAEEEMINADQPVRMAALIPGAELILIPGTGHFAPIAKRDEFNRIVLAFLAGESIATPSV